MVFDPLKPLKIPYKLHLLSANRILITLVPSKVGMYRVYLAYKNIPINGKTNIYCVCLSTDAREKKQISIEMLKEKWEL